MSNKSHFSSFLIIGGAGAVGSLFLKTLKSSFPSVNLSVLDVVLPKFPIEGVRYEQSIDEYQSVWHDFDCVILTLPEDVALRILEVIQPLLNHTTLVVDTLSIKTSIIKKVKSFQSPREYLSINPMFAPSLGFNHNSILAVKINPGQLTENFISLLESWGSKIKIFTAEEHDRSTAQLQCLTHATILAFGLSLVHSGYDIQQLLSIAPPPHKTLLCLIARILSGSPEVYLDIQRSNPYAMEMRLTLLDSLKTIDSIASENPTDSSNKVLNFDTLFSALQECLSEDYFSLAKQCNHIFSSYLYSK